MSQDAGLTSEYNIASNIKIFLYSQQKKNALEADFFFCVANRFKAFIRVLPVSIRKS